MRLQAYVYLGWSPILAVVADSERRVLQVTGWEGGSGTAPAINLYVGAAGYVSDISLAVDIRGDSGAGVDIQVGTNVISEGFVNFSNSNGVSFGLSGSTITASFNNAGGVAISGDTNSFSTGTVNFSNSNGVSFGLNTNNVMTATVKTDYQSSGNYLTTAMQSNAGSNFVGLNSALTGNGVSATINSSGISLNVPAFLTTAQPVGAYLTTARASNDAIGLNTAITQNGVSMTANSSGLSLNFPAFLTTAQAPGAYLTTAAQSNQVVNSLNGSTGQISLNVGSSLSSSTNGSSITFGLASNITTALQSAGAYLTTAMQSASSSNFAATGFTTTTIAGAAIAGTHDTNGLKLAVPAFLTTAALSSQTLAFSLSGNIATTNSSQILNGGYALAGGNGVTLQQSNNTVSISVATNYQSQGAYLTTADLSANSSKYIQNWKITGNTAGTTSSAQGTDLWLAGGNGLTISGSSNSISFSVATNYQSQGAYLTTAMQSNAATISNINVSAGAANNNLSAFVLSNSNGMSFGLNGSTVTADGRVILSSYEPYQLVGVGTAAPGFNTASTGVVSVYPFNIPNYVSAGILNLAYSLSFVTLGNSSGQQTIGFAAAIYSLNVSTLSSIASTSFSIGVTGNNSSYTVNQPTTTNYTGYGTGSTSSAGVNFSSAYTGLKIVGIPINSLLSPGQYWLAMVGTQSTSSIAVGISASFGGATIGTPAANAAPIGSYSSAYSTGQDPYGRWYVGQGRWNATTNVPASMAMSDVSGGTQITYPFMRFWRT